jgi:hypothetical protein
MIKYRIEYEPKPIPDTGYDWSVVNIDDEEDCHYFGSVEEAFDYINRLDGQTTSNKDTLGEI